MNSLFTLFGVLTLHAITTAAGALAAEADGGAVYSFKVTLASRVTMEVQGQKVGLTADTEVRYSWRRKDRERSLILDSVLIKAERDGIEIMNTFMSRGKLINIQQGRTNEITFAAAPDRLKSMLRESYGVPLCTLQVDEHGREVKRSVIAGQGAKDIIDNGMIANALLFHPPFLRGEDEWSADTEVSMGNRGYAKGKLRYRKQTGGQSRQICKVSGTLANDRFKQPASPVTITNARYVVNGEQTFDPVVNEWTSGRLTMVYAHQMLADEKSVGSSQGTITASFERLPVN